MFLRDLSTTILAFTALPALALQSNVIPATAPSTVAYKSQSLSIPEFNTKVPVACWFPLSDTNEDFTPTKPTYEHRISVRKIGQMLAQWNIPRFFASDYTLQPTGNYVVDGSALSYPRREMPVILLAHGYLGSRFDLSHLAEVLASRGFVCVAAEYPESLASSYDPVPGLDRKVITDALLQTLQKDWNIRASAYGIIGHSLGCGTAIQTGDDSWARVLISGFTRQRDGSPVQGNYLLVTSMGDGLANRFLSSPDAIPPDVVRLSESSILNQPIPKRAAIVYDRPDSPNHISFLTESTNDVMIEYLSPLLPVARLFNIPVLDFDRYQVSRDSKVTAEVYHPLIVKYMEQEMLGRRS
ncbi:hypothetical protein FisN_6Hh325 [Fistulifera solaris]|uniref:Uncharacterized protein n=1 Tax=Fistulifera solaris TaxID=1519565 RepID=A0A1Z5K759_FISSO|nr:hypothetical protein FisN_6Hh325 [Fistulifera solaris]|eukprot:GAX22077.1 hypothetical protein FisN_6Hh325 [Fistulifera solaris]